MRFCCVFLTLPLLLKAGPLTYDNLPLGQVDKPILIRTYLPDPGLADEVFANHGVGSASPKYNASNGKDVNGEYKPIKGIPAAIGVNHGPALSYAFDTTECRMLYAWQGGFLDMFPYWGDEKSGNRRSFGYVPSLVGKVFHMTEGSHPLQIDGVSVSKKGKPRYVGYDLDASGVPTFRFKFGEQEFTQRIEPLEDQPFSLRMILGTSGSGKLGWDGADEVKAEGASTTVTLRGRELSVHQGFDRNLRISKASVEAGEKVFMNYGCVACHSTDGANGHGPTLMNLFGREREIEGADKPVKADADYIRESIQKPNAKTAKGFPPNYMPPYVLKPVEIESLVLFIESLSGN